MTLTEFNILKSRAGVYEDTAENRRLHRVGQRYGEQKQAEDPKPEKNPVRNSQGKFTKEFLRHIEANKEKIWGDKLKGYSNISVHQIGAAAANFVAVYGKRTKDGQEVTEKIADIRINDAAPKEVQAIVKDFQENGASAQQFDSVEDLNLYYYNRIKEHKEKGQREEAQLKKDIEVEQKQGGNALSQLRDEYIQMIDRHTAEHRALKAEHEAARKAFEEGEKQAEPEKKVPSKVKIEQKTFHIKDGKIQASMYDTQSRINKLNKFAEENGFKVEWIESSKKQAESEEREMTVSSYAKITAEDLNTNAELKGVLAKYAKNPKDTDSLEIKNVRKETVTDAGTGKKFELLEFDLYQGGEYQTNFSFSSEGRPVFSDKGGGKEYLEEGEGAVPALRKQLGLTEEKKKAEPEPKEEPKKEPETNKTDEGSEEKYTKVTFQDIPNAGKVNLKKYLSDKLRKEVDNENVLDGLPADAVQLIMNDRIKRFNKNFDSMKKSERAKELYAIMKMKNFIAVNKDKEGDEPVKKEMTKQEKKARLAELSRKLYGEGVTEEEHKEYYALGDELARKPKKK